MRLAQDARIDAFMLNFAYDENTTAPGLENAFAAAAATGFKLAFSFDYAGNGLWPKKDVLDLLKQYANHPNYFKRGSQPLVSTFEGPESAEDWKEIKSSIGCFFIPDWSSLGAKPAMELGAADGLFNWAAWPTGPADMNTHTDASYLQYLDGKPYMMPVSPWFFTNMPGFDKNWLWRGDDLWFDRWEQVNTVDPEFVQIISWNDYGESHYIGPLPETEKGYEAFERGRAPFNYVRDMPHDAWRQFLPFVIDMWKNPRATITREGLVSWYRLSPSLACGHGGTVGNIATHLQLEQEPADMVQDKVFFSAQLGGSADVTVTIGGVGVAAVWENVPKGGVGIYHGSAWFSGRTGPVVVTISRSGRQLFQLSGRAIGGCSIQN